MRKIYANFLSLFILLLCAGIVKAQVTTYPWTETFSSSTRPTGWTEQNITGASPWAFVTVSGGGAITPRSATHMAQFRTVTSATNGDVTKLVSPQLNLSAVSSPVLTFYYASQNWFGDIDELRVYYKTSAAGSWVQVGGNYTAESLTWAKITLQLPNPSADYYIAFEGTSNWGYGVCVDDISVQNIPCLSPATLAVVPSATSAVLNWSASPTTPATGGGYQWSVTSSNTSASTGVVSTGSVNEVTTTATTTNPLSPLTTYYAWVRTTCNPDISDWTGPIAFQTPCATVSTFPFVETFETASTSRACWTTNDFVTNSISWTYANGAVGGGVTAAHGGTSNARFYLGSATLSKTRLVSPFFNLTSITGDVQVKFWHAQEAWGADQNELRLFYRTSPTGTWTLIPAAAYTSSVAAWTERTVLLPNTTGATQYQIAFEGTSQYGRAVVVDDVTVEAVPPCINPSGVSAITPIPGAATFNWVGSATATSGYEWAITTSNAAATPAVQTGTTTALTANVSGLPANTTYYLWVRSNCGGGLYSAWSAPIAFTTLCDVITAIPFTETFENASATRSCWRNDNVTGNINWTYINGSTFGSVTSSHGGSVNAEFMSEGGGEVTRLVSPMFSFAGLNQGATLNFWYVNEEFNFLGLIFQDQLRAYYRTTPNGAWTLIPTAEYTRNITRWTEVELQLPNSANAAFYQIAFEGISDIGNGILLDDVSITATPSCLPPTNLNAFGITSTQIVTTFVSPGNNFIVEYGTVGFTPGTGAAAGGGTLVTGPITGSPVTISGLSVGTTYDIYVRRDCGGGDISPNRKITATTLCAATNIPYLQNFESATVPNMPTCTSMEDVNGNSGVTPNAEGGLWTTFAGTSSQTYVSPTKAIRYIYDAADLTRGANDWFYTQGLNLTAGTEYRLKFFIKASNGPTWSEKLEVKYGAAAYSAAQTNTLWSNTNIATAIASPWDSVIVDFTPTTTGVQYIGFHVFSDADQAFLLLDDISVAIAPKVDAGATGLTLPTITCPTNNITFQTQIKNYNTKVLDYAVNNLEVIAAIKRPAPSTVTDTVRTKLTSGTLAAGATTNLYLAPAYNFTEGGTYSIKLYTSSPLDPIPGNDTLYRTVVVNPFPPVPTITSSAPALCLGAVTQLSVAAGVPGTAIFNGTSGNIALAIPDNSPAGITSTINATGIPTGSTVTGISVTINATHTWVSDYRINLIAPNGKILNLFNARGGSGVNLTNTVFNNTSTTLLTSTTAPFTGTFAADAAQGVGPTGALSDAAAFADLYSVAGGEWKLALRDGAAGDLGVLLNWSISFTYAFTPSVVWTPATNLFTNAAATTPYVAGTSAYTVFAKPTANATYTATATGAGGCSRTATTSVTVSTFTPVTIAATPDTLCITDPAYVLSAEPVGGVWSGIGVSGNNFIPGATAVGKYTLTYSYTNAGGCLTTATRVINVKDCPERNLLLSDSALYVYPNPSNGQFNIRINTALYEKVSMRVYSGSGMLVKTQELNNLRYGNVIPIDIRGLAGGLYFVQFYYESGQRASEKTFRVVIGHK